MELGTNINQYVFHENGKSIVWTHVWYKGDPVDVYHTEIISESTVKDEYKKGEDRIKLLKANGL
jgi:hypothetical protein